MRNFCKTQFGWASFAASFLEGNKENPWKLVGRWPPLPSESIIFSGVSVASLHYIFIIVLIIIIIIIIIIFPLAPLMSLMSRLEQTERPQKNQSLHDPACNMGKLLRKHNKQHEIFPPPPPYEGTFGSMCRAPFVLKKSFIFLISLILSKCRK